ncbi:MAG: J domain-containing protein [Ferruginibacter sp.]|nr:J domain-containing protein [Cytophagales bacterium]
MLDEYYHLLEVTPEASLEEIKRAYWRLAKQWHPDVNPSAEAKERFIRIHQAYEILVTYRWTDQSVPLTPDGSALQGELFGQNFRWDRNQDNRRERVAAFARVQYEEFRRNNERFKNSLWYWPAKVFTYFAWMVGSLAGVGFLFFPFWVAFSLQQTKVALTLFPFSLLVSLLGLAIVGAASRFRRELEQRYF